MRWTATNATCLLTILSGLLLGTVGNSVWAQQAGGSPSSKPGAQAQQAPSDDNSFPEDQSRKAAKEAADQKKKDNQAPAGESQPPDAPAAAPNSDSNTFPEDASRKAARDAKAAASGSSDEGDRSSGSGVSSSGDYDRRMAGNGRTAVPTNVPMPHVQGKDPVKEDVSVGTYYLQSGDFRGAYQRFKEATQLAPENMDAVFGLAEAARHLKKREEALTNYQLFLQVVDSGSKAKEARKAVATLDQVK